MTDVRAKQIQEIEALLAERRKYEQWLAQLETRKENTPSHVFVKVHRDYAARLGEAQQKLSSESGAVHALAKELDESLARLERQIAERADERAEAELRASVGEFAGKEWDKLRAKLDGAIAEFSSERDGIQRELDTLRALLLEAEPPAPDDEKLDVDDIAFLRSVLGQSTPYSTTPAPASAIPEPSTGERSAPRTGVPAGAPAAKRPSTDGVSAISEPVTGPRAAPAAGRMAEAATAPQPARDPAGEPEITAPRAAPAGRGQAAELFSMPEIVEPSSGPRATDDARPTRPSATFGRTTPRTSEAVKSLKCQECGTMNFPTEWYCERCGGELAAF